MLLGTNYLIHAWLSYERQCLHSLHSLSELPNYGIFSYFGRAAFSDDIKGEILHRFIHVLLGSSTAMYP